MFQPRKPDLIGKLQIKIDNGKTVIYSDKGDIALWEHNNTQYTLRGHITINGRKFLVSLRRQ